MGRHSAAEDASVDPVVAAALARRTAASPAGLRAHGGREQPVEDPHRGEVGWPAPSRRGDGGGGIGWPGEPSPEEARPEVRPDPADGDGTPGATADAPRRRGLRRLFGRAA